MQQMWLLSKNYSLLINYIYSISLEPNDICYALKLSMYRLNYFSDYKHLSYDTGYFAFRTETKSYPKAHIGFGAASDDYVLLLSLLFKTECQKFKRK